MGMAGGFSDGAGAGCSQGDLRSIDSGESFDDRSAAELRQCDQMVFLLRPDSMARDCYAALLRRGRARFLPPLGLVGVRAPAAASAFACRTPQTQPGARVMLQRVGKSACLVSARNTKPSRS